MSDFLARNSVLIGALVAIGVCNIAIGIMVPVVPPTLELQGLSARLIGLNTAMGQTGVLLAGLALPRLALHFTSKSMVLFAMVLMVVTFLLFAVSDPLWSWYGIRFLTGIGIAIMFTISETWITIEAGDHRRARVMGIYTSMLTVTFGVGPFLVSWTGVTTALPWLIGAGLMLLGLPLVARLKIVEQAKSDRPSSFLSVLKRAPVIYAAIVMTTLFEAVMLSFYTLYLSKNGFALETANQILGFGIIACLAFFYPVAQLADRWSRNKTALVCAALAVVGCLAVPLALGSFAIWPVTLLLRVGAFGLYIVALALIGDTFKGNDLVAAAALVAIGWGVGGIIGPPLAGLLIDNFGMAVLPFVLAACYVLALLAMALQRGKIVPDERRLASQTASGQ